MKNNNYGWDHPHAIVRGRVAGQAAAGTATLTTLQLVVITPPALAGNTDNWNPTGLPTADIIRASATAAYNLTGIVSPSDDRIIILDNIGTFSITLKHNVTSTAANRFLCPGDVDLALTPDTNVWLQYDLASLRWRVIGGTGTTIPSGTYETAINGGQDVIYAHGNMGATETFDPTLGNVHTGTLNANCTFTLSNPVGGGACTLLLQLKQDGTGGWTITWPGSVTWDGGTPSPSTTAGVTVRYILQTLDGGATWIGNLVGGASSPLTTKGDLYGFSTVNARIPVGANGQALLADSTAALGVSWGSAGTDTSAWQHTHIDNIVYSGDGSTTVFYLPASCVDAYSISVYVAASRSQDWVLSGAMFDILTFGSAPASSANNIVIDMIAVVV